MDILQLETFIALAREENMSAVAHSLNTSQPQISKLLASLEAELGVKLFDRVGRGIRLNKHGRIFLQYAMESTTAVKSGRAAMQNMKNSILGTVTILNRSFYPPVTDCILAFRRQHANVNMQLSAELSISDPDNYPDIMQTCSFDGTYTFQQKYPTRRDLFREEYCFLLSDRLRPFPEDRDSLYLSELIDLPFVITGQMGVEANADYNILSRAVDICGKMPHFAFVGVDFTMKMALVDKGAGVAILPAICFPDARKLAPHARFYRIADNPVTRTFILACKPRNQMSPVSREFWDFAMDYFDRNPLSPSISS